MNAHIQNAWDETIARNTTTPGINTTAGDPKAWLYGDGQLDYTRRGRNIDTRTIWEEIVILYRRWIMIGAVIGILMLMFSGSTQFLEAVIYTAGITLLGAYPYAKARVASRQQMYELD